MINKQDLEEVIWFVKNGQIRPRLLKNLYRLTDKQLQNIIDAYL